MYNFNGFGKRVLELRKQSGFTQEELASRVGVSPQAVSKWENESCYPDITLLPTLATILNTSIETLLGNGNGTVELPFPASYEELPFIHAYENIGVYSTKMVEKIDKTFVTFTDGSDAGLLNQLIHNKGAGDIKFLFLDDKTLHEKANQKSSGEFEFSETVKALKIKAECGNYKISVAHDGKTVVRVKGSPHLVGNYTAKVSGGVLQCDEIANSNQDGGHLEVDICMAKGDCKEVSLQINGSAVMQNSVQVQNLQIQINGSGNISQEGVCDSANVGINGSGDVQLTVCQKKLDIRINGSGDVTCSRCEGEMISTINGSGDIVVDQIAGNAGVNINGSGDVTLKSGELTHLAVDIRGSGDMDAHSITAQTANISVEKRGKVVLGRVVKESVEKHSKDSQIAILKRGQEE